MGIRYSQIVGELFYNIGLSSEHREICDIFFSASAHHYLLLDLCESEYDQEFHLLRHRAHLRAMKQIIFLYGDFTHAKDESLRGLETRAAWDPDANIALPDPRMYNSMEIDLSCGSVGEAHPFDRYVQLTSLSDLRSIYRLAN